MFKTFELGDQPHTMTVFAQATWNAEKGCWEVDIVQSETNHCGIIEKFSMGQTTHHVEVEDCDEFVIADALLHANGIMVQELYQCHDNPIVKGEW